MNPLSSVSPYPDDAALVEACAAGDCLAWQTFVSRYHRCVRQTVSFQARRTQGTQEADIDDAVQQVFIAFLADDGVALRRWRAQAQLKTYLCRIAERVARRHFQLCAVNRGRFRLSMDDPDDGSDTQREDGHLDDDAFLAEATLIAEEDVARLRAASLERLSPKGRQYYEYLFVRELDVETVAKLENTNANNVYQWRNRITRVALDVLEAAGYRK